MICITVECGKQVIADALRCLRCQGEVDGYALKRMERKSMKSKPKFTNVEFPGNFPPKQVADHQVYMSFTHDDDAIVFRVWWEQQGSFQFAKWIAEQK